MGTHLIPREISGDGRILYIFTGKGFLFTLGGLAIGFVFKAFLSAFGAGIVGWIVMALFALIGWAIGQGVIPDTNATSFFRKVGGLPIDTIIKRFFKFNRTKKIYVTKVTAEKKAEQENT